MSMLHHEDRSLENIILHVSDGHIQKLKFFLGFSSVFGRGFNKWLRGCWSSTCSSNLEPRAWKLPYKFLNITKAWRGRICVYVEVRDFAKTSMGRVSLDWEIGSNATWIRLGCFFIIIIIIRFIYFWEREREQGREIGIPKQTPCCLMGLDLMTEVRALR